MWPVLRKENVSFRLVYILHVCYGREAKATVTAYPFTIVLLRVEAPAPLTLSGKSWGLVTYVATDVMVTSTIERLTCSQRFVRDVPVVGSDSESKGMGREALTRRLFVSQSKETNAGGCLIKNSDKASKESLSV
ncbi:hypothetical protein EVAR_2340_1 [Eumeta japonica]|uniref:Uncharacterized protein n=1 Tax=Eumeta variegata TaxID=151549 RepID=A0A4C1SIX2_EUMVA|nr:hypothetical protein EVAR_2340_1 [Eumeta japonica]